MIGGLALVCWRYREWLRTFVSRLGPSHGRSLARSRSVVRARAGHRDIARRYRQYRRATMVHPAREALGLLYRGLLSRLLHEFDLPLTSADTEGQVLERIHHLQQPQLLAFSDELTRHWQTWPMVTAYRPLQPNKNCAATGVLFSVTERANEPGVMVGSAATGVPVGCGRPICLAQGNSLRGSGKSRPVTRGTRQPLPGRRALLRQQGVVVAHANGLERLAELPAKGHSLLLLGSAAT